MPATDPAAAIGAVLWTSAADLHGTGSTPALILSGPTISLSLTLDGEPLTFDERPPLRAPGGTLRGGDVISAGVAHTPVAAGDLAEELRARPPRVTPEDFDLRRRRRRRRRLDARCGADI